MSKHTTPPPCLRPRRPLRGLLLGALGLLLGSCAASGPVANTGDALRVVLYDYGGNQRLEVVSESYADPVEYASTARRKADRKFLPDTVLAAFLDYLDEEGMDAYGQEGKAPRSGGRIFTRSFEVERNGHTRHWPVGTGTESQERLIFTTLTFEYVNMYTGIPAYQAIENPEGHDLFRAGNRPQSGR